jgi:hypothetical protein
VYLPNRDERIFTRFLAKMRRRTRGRRKELISRDEWTKIEKSEQLICSYLYVFSIPNDYGIKKKFILKKETPTHDGAGGQLSS